MIDYKISQMTVDDNNEITRALVRFYEGEVSTEDEENGKGEKSPINRFRRTKMLEEAIYQPREFKPANKGRNFDDLKDLKKFLNDEALLKFPNHKLNG